MKVARLNIPLTTEKISPLKAGDKVSISGVIYTARDQAHKRMIRELLKGGILPFDIGGAVIYYCGPTPARPGKVIGSCGPTTSARMDKFTPALLDAGLKGMIGKGERGGEVIDSIKKNRAVYFAAVGGAGALLSTFVKGSKVIAYDDLGAEAVRELTVKDFPAIVAIDSRGNNLFERRL